MALSVSRIRTIAVVHRIFGRETASLFQPSNRFFRADGPYLYPVIRYYLFMGAGVQALQGRGGGLGLTGKPPEAELEPLEFEDQSSGEFRSLGSPSANAPKSSTASISTTSLTSKTSLTATTALKTPAAPKPAAALDNFTPPTVPVIPGAPVLPPTAPVLPTTAPVPGETVSKIPVEILLLDSQGLPMANTGFKAGFPDGTVVSGNSDRDGFVRIPDNTQSGELVLTLPGLPKAA